MKYPIERLGGDKYKFGDKKISAKVTNGNLIVRVGGGWASFEEFIKKYSKEFQKRVQKKFSAELKEIEDQKLNTLASTEEHLTEQSLEDPSTSLNEPKISTEVEVKSLNNPED